jgi:hypothetical protein
MITNKIGFGIEFGTALGAAPLSVVSAGCGLTALAY